MGDLSEEPRMDIPGTQMKDKQQGEAPGPSQHTANFPSLNKYIHIHSFNKCVGFYLASAGLKHEDREVKRVLILWGGKY